LPHPGVEIDVKVLLPLVEVLDLVRKLLDLPPQPRDVLTHLVEAARELLHGAAICRLRLEPLDLLLQVRDALARLVVRE